MNLTQQEHKLGDVAEMIRGVTFGRSEGQVYPAKNHLPVLRAGNIQDRLIFENDLVWVPQSKISRSQLIKQNDIIMCTSSGSAAIVGKCAISESDWVGSFGAFCIGIRPKTTKCVPSFLLHYLHSPAFTNWSKNSSGANIKNIRKSELEDFTIPLPQLPEQKRIAAILDKAAAIRRKRQAAIKLADNFLRATFIDMFGDPVTNPKGWDLKPLSKLCDVRDGTHDSPKYVRDGFPLITSKNVKNGNLDFSDVSLISEADFIQINKRSAVDVGDIIMPMIGTIGNPVLVETSKKFAIKNVALIKFAKAIVRKEYILYLLRSHYFEWIIQRSNRGGTQKFIALNDIRSFPIPVPDEKSQQRFSSLCIKIKNLKANEDKLNSDSSSCFNSLTQRAFRGEL